MSSSRSIARVIGLLRPMKDVTVTAGETATFDCELSYEGISVEWFLGGTKLEPSDRVSINLNPVMCSDSKNNSLNIKNKALFLSICMPVYCYSGLFVSLFQT